jgi:hypothetical protein
MRILIAVPMPSIVLLISIRTRSGRINGLERDSGDFSNENPHQKVEQPNRNFPRISPDMSGDTVIATNLTGLRCEESCSREKIVRGWIGTLP